jgi:hypothetical protein
LLSLVIDGSWLGSEDNAQMEAIMGHEVQGAINIPIITPIINWAKTFWKVVSWDFSFFSGGLQIVRWFLFVISAGAVFALVQEFRGTTTSIFGRR